MVVYHSFNAARVFRASLVKFRDNVGLFELGWYSLHPVSGEMVESYRRGLEQIRTYAV